MAPSSPDLRLSATLKEITLPKPATEALRMTFGHPLKVEKAGLGLE
jgi:hypothetical protein